MSPHVPSGHLICYCTAPGCGWTVSYHERGGLSSIKTRNQKFIREIHYLTSLIHHIIIRFVPFFIMELAGTPVFQSRDNNLTGPIRPESGLPRYREGIV